MGAREPTPSGTRHTRDTFGLCQWFHYQDYTAVERTIELLQRLGVHHLRTGISWADFHRPAGAEWYAWQMRALQEAEIDVLVSIWHTPPSIAEGGTCSSPPRRLGDYGDFVAQAIDLYGEGFSAVELWNEPNNRLKWNFREYDPDWSKFAAMVRHAARAAKDRGKTTVLGGMIPVDHYWLELIDSHGGLDHMDVIGIHAFPGMWWCDHEYCWDWETHWNGWEDKIAYVRQSAGGRPIWVTESGFSTWEPEAAQSTLFHEQTQRLSDALNAPAERMYWYCAHDLAPERACIEMTEDGGRVDHNEYHLGLVTDDGWEKPACRFVAQWVRAQQRAAPTGTEARPRLR